eukprot:1288175-Rhodomonas_salina.1
MNHDVVEKMNQRLRLGLGGGFRGGGSSEGKRGGRGGGGEGRPAPVPWYSSVLGDVRVWCYGRAMRCVGTDVAYGVTRRMTTTVQPR